MVANPSPVEVAFPTGVRDLAMGGSSTGFTSGHIALCGLYGGADVRCLGVYPGEGSTETAYPLRINWTGAGL
jgi:hypothetical protein